MNKIYHFDLGTKALLLSVADPVDEYIVSVGVSFGLNAEDFVMLTKGQLEPLLHTEIPIQMPEIMTNSKVPACLFIDHDAHFAIQRLLKQMNKEERTDQNEKMVLYEPKELNRELQVLFKKAGIKAANYNIVFHILRRFLAEKLAEVSDSKLLCNLILGKTAAATRTAQLERNLRETYREVMKLTNVYYELVPLFRYVERLRDNGELRKTILKQLGNRLLH